MEETHKPGEKKIRKNRPKTNKNEENSSNNNTEFLQKKTKREKNKKGKSKSQKSNDSSKIAQINNIYMKSSELESLDYERETSSNSKKINFKKTNNKNINDNTQEKKENFIKLNEKKEDNCSKIYEEQIFGSADKNSLKNDKTKSQIANNSSKEKKSDDCQKRNNNFKNKNNSQILINKKNNTNRQKKERKISDEKKDKLKNNMKIIKINSNSNEEIMSIADEEKRKNSKIKKNSSDEKEEKGPSNRERKRLNISKNKTIFTSEENESLYEGEISKEQEKNSANNKRKISIEKENNDSENINHNKHNNPKLFIGNISYKTKKNELNNLFKKYGDIKQIKIFKNNRGKSKGYGFIEFNNRESAISAMKNVNQRELGGRRIRLDYWKSKIDKRFEEIEKMIKNEKRELKENSQKNKRELEENARKDKRELEEKLKETNKNVAILAEINIQSEKYINIYVTKKLNNINMKLNCVINAFKVLYYRKIANFILDGLVKNYPNSLGVTSCKFHNQRSKFNLIIAIEEIKGIDIYQINLIVDFLMHCKEKTSSIIHINEKTISIQRIILNRYIKKIRNKKDDSNNSEEEEIIKIDEMVDTLFKNPIYIEEAIKLNENENEDEIIQLKSIIEKEKAKINEKNNNNDNNAYDDDNIDNDDNEDNIDQKSDDSSTSNSEYDVKKLQRILDGEENIELDSYELLEILHKKIILNKQKVKEDFNEFGVEEINPNYFYNSWKQSFEKENYKTSRNYTHFIKKDQILPLKDIGDNIMKLLENYQVNVYIEDPGNFDKNIETVVKGYKTKNGEIISVNWA